MARPDLPSAPTGLRRKAVVGGLWSIVQALWENVCALLGFLVLAHLIAPADFGIVAMAAVFVGVITLISDLGVTPALVRGPEPGERRLATGFWISVGLSCVLCGAIQFAAPAAASWFGQPSLVTPLRVMAASVPLGAACIVPTALLLRELRFKPLAFRRMLAVTVATCGAITLAALGFDVWALVFLQCGTVVLDVVVLYAAVRWRPTWAFSRTDARELVGFGIAVTLRESTIELCARAVDVIIGKTLGPAALGIWTVAGRVSGIVLNVFMTAIGTVAMPAFAAVASDRDILATAYRHAVRVVAVVVFPAMAVVAATSPVAVPLLFGEQWSLASTLAEVIAIDFAIRAITWLTGSLLLAVGQPRVALAIVLVTQPLDVALVWLVAPHGLLTVAIADLILTAVTTPLTLMLVRRTASLPRTVYRDLPPALLCVGILYAALWGVRVAMAGAPGVVTLGVELVVAAVVYLGASRLFQHQSIVEVVNDLKRVRTRPGEEPS